MLISYMGIDLLNRGERVYRLLGCTLTYHGDLPEPGETLQYEIRIDRHARHGDVRLFFFEYDCISAGRPAADGPRRAGRVLQPPRARRTRSASCGRPSRGVPRCRRTLASTPRSSTCTKSSFDREEVVAFSEGRVVDCFGPGYEWADTHTRTPTIQAGRQLFIDEVTSFDPRGGPWGRGFMRCATADHAGRVVLRRALPERPVHAGQLHGRGLRRGPVVLPGCARPHGAPRRLAVPARAGAPVRAEVPR